MVEVDEKCQYKTGKCRNKRAIKRNGKSHTLCEVHRMKQNLIQRKSDQKHRVVNAVRRKVLKKRLPALCKKASVDYHERLYQDQLMQDDSRLHVLPAPWSDEDFMLDLPMDLDTNILSDMPVFAPAYPALEALSVPNSTKLKNEESKTWTMHSESPTGTEDVAYDAFLSLADEIDLSSVTDSIEQEMAMDDAVLMFADNLQYYIL